MSLISRIARSPDGWTGSDIVDALFMGQYAERDRRRDPEIPQWLRDVLVLGDLETQLQMEGLLGWWENRAADELDLVCTALVAVGWSGQAELLREVDRVLPAIEAASGGSVAADGTISSFDERHPDITPRQHALLRTLEQRLWFNDPSGSDLYEQLATYASAHLAVNG